MSLNLTRLKKGISFYLVLIHFAFYVLYTGICPLLSLFIDNAATFYEGVKGGDPDKTCLFASVDRSVTEP